MIEATDLTGVDENTALRVIAYAISIAPCIDSLPAGGRDRKLAVALLVGVGKEMKARGSRQLKSQRIGPAAVDYVAVASCFSAEDRSALRALCVTSAGAGNPIGSFPTGRPVSRIWPEEYSS